VKANNSNSNKRYQSSGVDRHASSSSSHAEQQQQQQQTLPYRAAGNVIERLKLQHG
jgi:hypothetical protein